VCVSVPYQIFFKCTARQPGNAKGNSFSFETRAKKGEDLAGWQKQGEESPLSACCKYCTSARHSSSCTNTVSKTAAIAATSAAQLSG